MLSLALLVVHLSRVALRSSFPDIAQFVGCLEHSRAGGWFGGLNRRHFIAPGVGACVGDGDFQVLFDAGLIVSSSRRGNRNLSAPAPPPWQSAQVPSPEAPVLPSGGLLEKDHTIDGIATIRNRARNAIR